MKNRKRSGIVCIIHSIKTYLIGTVISVMKLAMLAAQDTMRKQKILRGIQK